MGILLDGLHWALLEGARSAAPQLHCVCAVPALGYADDYCLLGTLLAHLHHLLDIAYAFLTCVTIELSLDKTKILVFGVALGKCSGVDGAAGVAWAAAPHVVWTCGGLPLEGVAEYKYMGVVFSAVAGSAKAAFERLRGKQSASWDRLRQQFGNLRDGLSFALQRAMFQQSVLRQGPMLASLEPPAPAGPGDPGSRAGGAFCDAPLAAGT